MSTHDAPRPCRVCGKAVMHDYSYDHEYWPAPKDAPAHSCTLGHLMEGHVIDGVFCCAHGVALGTPEPVQPDPPLVLKATFPPYGWCPSPEAPIVDSDGRRAHEWINDERLCSPVVTRHCSHCNATVTEPLPAPEPEPDTRVS